MNIREHYENHLANYYSWMFGDFNAKLNENYRFIPVNNDNNRIFTCFLEYHPTYVKVFDIVYERA